ncbi:hypothetical protein B4U45_26665 [Mycobacterium persicum]|uniref:Uncharacterized protein n=1 Tax=Mycobacterium persicum TaxID=1487726 RepID=A0A8E2LQI5_9MYCO|nr:hypothetical protein A4G31_25410 [Mycobacterium persicum]ORB44090.1 hypothetical protein BST40_19985 [Mycobacterium persicum]ORB92190.1 hypothetical protein B1T49_26360 [Mycobacterium persicum]ORB97577.1 hypothetical protein B1T44_27145 [Mycobacterium persicum]ORC04250.1 hypothetical protein B1T48_26430 [Mycobacterium persicum]
MVGAAGGAGGLLTGGVDDSPGGYSGAGSSTRIFQVTPVTAKTASAPIAKPATVAPITTPVEWRRPAAAPVAGGGGGLVWWAVMLAPMSVKLVGTNVRASD